MFRENEVWRCKQVDLAALGVRSEGAAYGRLCLHGWPGRVRDAGSPGSATWSSLLHSLESAPCHSPADSRRQKSSLRLPKKNEA